MKSLVDQGGRFLRLADRDVRAFNVLKPVLEVDLPSVCFHAQQAVEKCLKGVLVFHGINPTRTHDLEKLVHELKKKKVELPLPIAVMNKLNPYAVIFRYDDTEIEILSRDEAEKIVVTVFEWAKNIIK